LSNLPHLLLSLLLLQKCSCTVANRSCDRSFLNAGGFTRRLSSFVNSPLSFTHRLLGWLLLCTVSERCGSRLSIGRILRHDRCECPLTSRLLLRLEQRLVLYRRLRSVQTLGHIGLPVGGSAPPFRLVSPSLIEEMLLLERVRVRPVVMSTRKTICLGKRDWLSHHLALLVRKEKLDGQV